MPKTLSLIGLLFLIALPGCSTPLGEVKGKVTGFNPNSSKMESVTLGEVIFVNPSRSTRVKGIITAQGTFVAQVPLGLNKVLVEPDEDKPSPAIAKIYREVETTPLEFNVVAGSQTLDIVMEGGKSK